MSVPRPGNVGNPYGTEAVLARAPIGLSDAVARAVGPVSRETLAEFASVIEELREPYRTDECMRLIDRLKWRRFAEFHEERWA